MRWIGCGVRSKDELTCEWKYCRVRRLSEEQFCNGSKPLTLLRSVLFHSLFHCNATAYLLLSPLHSSPLLSLKWSEIGYYISPQDSLMDCSDSVPSARIISYYFSLLWSEYERTLLCNSPRLNSRELLRPLFINASSDVSVTSTLGANRAILRNVLEGLKKRYRYCGRTRGAYRPGGATSTLPLHIQLPRLCSQRAVFVAHSSIRYLWLTEL